MAKGHIRLLQYGAFRCSSESLVHFISISDCELATKVRNISKESNVVELCKIQLENKTKFHVKFFSCISPWSQLCMSIVSYGCFFMCHDKHTFKQFNQENTQYCFHTANCFSLPHCLIHSWISVGTVFNLPLQSYWQHNNSNYPSSSIS